MAFSTACWSVAPEPIVSTMVRSDLIPCSLWRYSAAKKTSAKAVAASFQVGSLAIEGCILANGMRSFFCTRSASSARDDGGSALPAGPRQRDSRYLAIASWSQMGTELCPVWVTTRCVYSCARVSSQS